MIKLLTNKSYFAILLSVFCFCSVYYTENGKRYRYGEWQEHIKRSQSNHSPKDYCDSLRKQLAGMNGNVAGNKDTSGMIISNILCNLSSACGRFDSTVTLEITNRLLNDSNPAVRRTAAACIGKLGENFIKSDLVINALKSATDDSDPCVRVDAAVTQFKCSVYLSEADTAKILNLFKTIFKAKKDLAGIPRVERYPMWGVYPILDVISILKHENNQKAKIVLQELLNDPDSSVSAFVKLNVNNFETMHRQFHPYFW